MKTNTESEKVGKRESGQGRSADGHASGLSCRFPAFPLSAPTGPGRGQAPLRPLRPVSPSTPAFTQALLLTVALRRAYRTRRATVAQISTLLEKLEAIPGVMTFKAWVAAEMERTGLEYGCIFYRLQRGQYPDLIRIQVNTRLVYVLT